MHLSSAPFSRLSGTAVPEGGDGRPPIGPVPPSVSCSPVRWKRSSAARPSAALPGLSGPLVPPLASPAPLVSLAPHMLLAPFALLLSLSLLLLPFLPAPRASAHPLSVASSELRLQSGSAELVFAIDDLSAIESVPGIDLNGDEGLDAAETERARDAIADWLLSKLSLSAADTPLAGKPAAVSLQARGGKRMVVTKIRYAAPPEASAFRYQDRLYADNGATTYVDMLVIRSGTHVAELALSGNRRAAAFTVDAQGIRPEGGTTENDGTDTSSGSDAGAANAGGATNDGGIRPEGGSSWSSFFLLGIRHILTGYDHLLFLLALLLRKQKLLDYLKIATAFTIAHSLTLTLAVLGWNPLPSRMVEVLIALSIVYVAVENLFNLNRERRWQLTFVFGLVHGLGFAGILSELDIPRSHLAVSLVSFNLGIEIVQLALIAAASPLLKAFQESGLYRRGFAVGSMAILGMGALWAIERLL